MEEALELQEEMQDVLQEEMKPDELQKVTENLPEAAEAQSAPDPEELVEELQKSPLLYRPFDLKV